MYVAPGSRFEKEAGDNEDRYYHLILLAENNEGYANLCKIVSKGFVEGFYYKPRVDYEVLEKYHEGIICLSACLAGEVQKYLARGEYEKGKEAALKYEKIFIFIHIFTAIGKNVLLKTKISITSSTDKSAPTSITIVVPTEETVDGLFYMYPKR